MKTYEHRLGHRKILVTGTSPAEFNHRILGKPEPKTAEEFRKIYEPLGYTFDD